jgi:protein SCO1/2
MKKAMNFVAAAGDTSYTEDGMPYYFFVHTDRISLIDQEGKIRKNYKGSRIDINEIIKDIKTIED